MSIVIKPMQPEDWPQVRDIYEQGIQTGNATFATEAPDWQAWDTGHLKTCRITANIGDKLVGWAALSAVSSRCVYAGVAEVSIYIASNARGQGVGKALLQALAQESETQGLWTLQAGIFPENEASIATHTACGFRQVGRRERLGKMKDRWRDILLLERRSELVGKNN